MARINRRQLAKGLAAGASLAGGALLGQISNAGAESLHTLVWEKVYPGIWRTTVGVPETKTPVRTRLVGPAEHALQRLPGVGGPPLPQLEGAVTSRGSLVRIPLESQERMYGFGLQMLSFQQRSKKRIIRVNADPKGDSGDSHAPVPFYVTTKGYGVLVDTFRHAEFYCGEAHPKPTRAMTATTLQVNTPQQMRAGDRGRASEVLVEVPRCAGVDVYVFAGPTMLQAVQRYNLFSGGGVLPPAWGLGFWYRPEMHLSAKAVLALAEELRSRKIPCDVLGLEPGWQTHAYSCTFAWDRSRFPNPAGFLNSAKRLGYRVNLWEHAFTHPASPIFAALEPYAGDYAVWEGLVPDFAGEPARRIFGEYHGKELIDAGVSGFKLDECDNSDFTEGWSFPDASRFPSGFDGEQMHAAFGLRYQSAIWEQFRSRKQETYGLVRSSGALAAPYPFVLYSDLYDHRAFVRALVNASFSGLLWCPEVRDAVSEEDLIRRLQTVVFSPLAMVNAWYIRNPPWKQLNRDANNADRLTEGWERMEARCREIIGWRMQLGPYLLAAFAKYALDGTPPFRALALDFPEETALATVDDEYMVGDRMLVAPMFAGEAERKVTLPAGEWNDFWTGSEVRGGATFTVPASFERVPVYVRAGSIVPWADVGLSSDGPESRRLTARVYGDGGMAWTGAGRDLEGLRLSWVEGPGNRGAGRGEVDGAKRGERPYSVIAWRRIG